MARLKFRNQTPPRGWFYVQPQTQFRLEGDSFSLLVDAVIAHRKYKQLEPVDRAAVELEVERQLCSRLGKDECRAEGVDDEWVPIDSQLSLKPAHLLSATRAAVEWLQNNLDMVPKAEYERRAGICRNCPAAQPLTGCKCGSLFKLVSSLLPKDRRDDSLGICGVCGCINSVKSNVPMSVIEASNKGRLYKWPEGCWQKKP